MPLDLVLIGTALAAASGFPGLCLDRRSPGGERIAAALMACASTLALLGAGLALAAGPGDAPAVAMPLMNATGTLAIDPLSAFFLFPIHVMGGLGAVYGLGYWRQEDHPANGRRLRLFWGLLVAGMSVLVLARHALLFLLGWEVMALSAFFLVGTEDHLEHVRWAGWVYLIATHVGVLALFAMFGLLRVATGSFDLQPPAAGGAGLGLPTAVFFLSLVAFGVKAGLMPLHFWLPVAHANAPSHVSAMLSGVVLKTGIYGLVRVCGLLPQPPMAWGVILLALGAISGVLGVAFAIGQHDLKRLLAYHSVENIGIILMGLGLAMIGRSAGRADWVVLGLAGCLLHVWNHALFKSLLFLGAGSVLHAAGTREIDRLGGLAKTMPWTAGLFLVGAAAICGLPPLNGFVSELLIFLGLFRAAASGTGASGLGAALGAPALALIGALALACFVKAYGAVFLGAPRSAAAADVHESPVTLLAPMGALAACCLLIGLAPFALAPVLENVIAGWTGTPLAAPFRLATLAPLTTIALLGGALAAAAGVAAVFLVRQAAAPATPRALTWDCGYARPAPRMQYTASSFAQMLVGFLRRFLRPRVHLPEIQGLFAASSRFESHVDDVVLDGQLVPFGRAATRWLGGVRRLQQGLIQHYVLYILVTVVVLLAWTVPVKETLARLFGR